MSISNFYTIIDVNFKFSTRPKSETIIPRYINVSSRKQNYKRIAIQTKILSAGSEKIHQNQGTWSNTRQKRREPKFIYHLLITEHWKSVSGFLFKKENKCSMFLPPN